MNTLSQKLGKLEEGTLQPACCEAQTDHTAKLECHGQPAPQAIDFALCFGKVVRSLVLWTEPRSRVDFNSLSSVHAMSSQLVHAAPKVSC